MAACKSNKKHLRIWCKLLLNTKGVNIYRCYLFHVNIVKTNLYISLINTIYSENENMHYVWQLN